MALPLINRRADSRCSHSRRSPGCSLSATCQVSQNKRIACETQADTSDTTAANGRVGRHRFWPTQSCLDVLRSPRERMELVCSVVRVCCLRLAQDTGAEVSACNSVVRVVSGPTRPGRVGHETFGCLPGSTSSVGRRGWHLRFC